MRFGLVFEGMAPDVASGFMSELGLAKVEGCSKDGRSYMMICTLRPRKPSDVEGAVAAYNETATERIELLGDDKVSVFEKGNKFRVHPIGQAILRRDETYWCWPLAGKKQKRAVEELRSDLVQVKPSAVKRVKVIRPCVIGGSCWLHLMAPYRLTPVPQTGTLPPPSEEPAPGKTKKMRPSFFRPAMWTDGGQHESIISLLVKEVTRSKDETIQCKNQIIEMLRAGNIH